MKIYKKKKTDHSVKNFYVKRAWNNSILFKDYVLYLTGYEYDLITGNLEFWTESGSEIIEVISEMIYSNNIEEVPKYVKTAKEMDKFMYHKPKLKNKNVDDRAGSNSEVFEFFPEMVYFNNFYDASIGNWGVVSENGLYQGDRLEFLKM